MIIVKTYEATVAHVFRARHAVRLEDGGLEPPHDHEWRVSATFRANSLDEPMGAVIDFAKAKAALEAAAGELERIDLNAHAAFADKSSTAERVAEYIACRLAESFAESGEGAALYSVTVTEAPGCLAAFYPQGA